MLTCVHKQARQGTDQLQGQDGQNEVQVPCAGLREGVLQAEEEEECRAACREEMCTAGAQPGSWGPSHHHSRGTTGHAHTQLLSKKEVKGRKSNTNKQHCQK